MKRRRPERAEDQFKKRKTEITIIGECQTKQELEQFTCDELREFMSRNAIKQKGTKADSVERIFDHLGMRFKSD